MTIKSLTELTIREAIDGTARYSSRELRELVRRLARKRFGEGEILLRLQAILLRSAQVTEKRNNLLHSVWAHELDGDPVIRGRDHDFQPIPEIHELEAVADEISRVTDELNGARLKGFLSEAIEATRDKLKSRE
jgi:hypothetical protein